MSMFLNFNGEIREEGVALLRVDNRGFRYGDGLFETMLFRDGSVRLGQYHLERLMGGMRLLRLDSPPRPADTADALALAICHLWRGPQTRLVSAALAARQAGPAPRRTPAGGLR